MKEKDAQVSFDQHQVTLFVEKEDGSYGPLQTGSFVAKNFVPDLIKNIGHFHKKALSQVTDNEISAVAYYMILREMSPADVAARIGTSTGHVKRHMSPRFFKTMTIETAKKYADLFGIPLANLFQISTQSATGFIETPVLEQRATNNPLLVTIA
jgi:hypothetical protein